MSIWLQVILFGTALFTKEIYQANEEAVVAAMFVLCVSFGYKLISESIGDALLDKATSIYQLFMVSWKIKQDIYYETFKWFSYTESILLVVKNFVSSIEELINNNLKDSALLEDRKVWERNIVIENVRLQMNDIVNKELYLTKFLLDKFTTTVYSNIKYVATEWNSTDVDLLLDNQIRILEHKK
jgi:hypothetical protein